MSTITFLDLVIIIPTMAFAGQLAKKDAERFNKLMANTLNYVMGIGVVFCFIQLLAEWHLLESLMTRLLAVPARLSPISFMAVVSFLFLCSFAMEKWSFKTDKRESHV